MRLLSETAIDNCSSLSTKCLISLRLYMELMLSLFKDSDICGDVQKNVMANPSNVLFTWELWELPGKEFTLREG